MRAGTARMHHRMAGQKIRQVFGHSYGSYAGTAAAMGYREGLVQVQMTHVSPYGGGTGKPYLGIHVGTVHIHLSAVTVYDLRHLFDAALEDTVRGGVGDHESRQPLLMFFGQAGQRVHVDVTPLVTIDHHHLHAGHHRAGGVGAVSRRGDQHHITLRLAP